MLSVGTFTQSMSKSQPTTSDSDTASVPTPTDQRSVTHNDDGSITVSLAPMDKQYADAVGVAREAAFPDSYETDRRSYGGSTSDRISDGVEGVLAVAVALGIPPSDVGIDARETGDDGYDLSLPLSADGSLTDMSIQDIDVKLQSDLPVFIRQSKVDNPSCDMFMLLTREADGIRIWGCITPDVVRDRCDVEESPVPRADHDNYVVEKEDMCPCPSRLGSVPLIAPGG